MAQVNSIYEEDAVKVAFAGEGGSGRGEPRAVSAVGSHGRGAHHRRLRHQEQGGGGGLRWDAESPAPTTQTNCWPEPLGRGGGLASTWSGCSVRIRLWPRLPHGCHRFLPIMPVSGASTVRQLIICSSLDPASAGQGSGRGDWGKGGLGGGVGGGSGLLRPVTLATNCWPDARWGWARMQKKGRHLRGSPRGG